MQFLKNLFTSIYAWFNKSTVSPPKPAPPPSVPGDTKPEDPTPWMTWAENEMKNDVSEKLKPSRVAWYHSFTSLPHSEQIPATPWCSSFVCAALANTGYKNTDDAWARSYLEYGIRLDAPKPGCLVIYDRGNGNGHVHLFEYEKNGYLYGLGGNQHDSVNISPYLKSNVLGYRWPIK